MATDITDIVVPSVGESITEVIVSEWLKPEGAWVEKDEPLVTLETDKVNVDVPAPKAGVLTKILKAAEETAIVGDAIGNIDAAAAKPAGDAPSPAAATAAPEAAPVAAAAKVMPAAQRVLSESGVDASSVAGSGPGGRVLKTDASAAVKAPAAKAATAPAPVAPVAPTAPALGGDALRPQEVVRMTGLRKRIAQRLVEAQHNAALLTTFNEIDMTQVINVRKRFKDQFAERYGIKLGFMSFFVKAAIDALRLVPQINAQIDGDNIVYNNFYDIGVAVDSGKGLVVPVVRNAELLSFAEVEQTIADLGSRARAGKLTLPELQGGTFTISNGGVFGSLMSTPIVNPPQSGILGMHATQERPVGRDGRVELRPMMYVALTYDHRIVDGRGAVTFLKRIKDCIEDPERMLLEI